MKINVKDLGLSEKEARVYLYLIKFGQLTVQNLAEETQIKRSTCYLYLEHLQQLGLVCYVINNKKKYFVAENPYRLLNLAEKERQKAEKREQKIMAIIPLIKKISKESRSEVKIKHYKGIEGIWSALEDSINNPNTRYFIGSHENLLKILGRENFTKNYTDKRRNFKNKAYIISDHFNQPFRDYFSDQNFREVKYLPKNIKTNSSVWFYGDRILLINLTKPYSATIIVSSEIVSLCKFMFEIVWKSL